MVAADPDSLGQMRPLLHQEVTDQIILEMSKTQTSSSIRDIDRTIRTIDICSVFAAYT